MEGQLWPLLVAFGVPTAATGFFVWLFKRSIDRRDAQQAKAQAEKERKAEEREKNREKLIVQLLQSTMAAIALSEATAKAVQRIPDAHCNGDMHAALDYATKVKQAQRDFLERLGVHTLYDD